jgi:hypothetical protein
MTLKSWLLMLAASGLMSAGPTTGQPVLERTALVGRGRSMLPTLPEACRLVVVRVPLREVRVGVADGDIVATRLNGVRVIHRAVERRPDGSLVTWGDNNARHDPLPTTEQNYVGIVIGFETPGQAGELVPPAPRHRPHPEG